MGLLLLLQASAGTSFAAFSEVSAGTEIALTDSMSYTAAFVDSDGDGDLEIFANNHWKSPAELYRNDGGGAFTSVSSRYVPLGPDRHDQGWADFNNDGLPDQYIIKSRTQPSELWINHGYNVFEDIAIPAGVHDTDGRGRELTLADFNNDGWLDIFIVNDFRAGFVKPTSLYWNRGDGTFMHHPNTALLFQSRLHCSGVDYDLDGNVDILVTNGPWTPGEVYHSNGDSTWTDVTNATFPGITTPLTEADGMAWGDYDDDGWIDLYASGGNRGVWDFVGLEGDSIRYYAEADSGKYKVASIVTDGDSVTIDAIQGDYQPVTCFYGGAGLSTSTYPATLPIAQLDGTPPNILSTHGLFVWRKTGATVDTVHVSAGGKQPTGLDQLLVGGSIRANGSGILSWFSAGYQAPPPYSTHDWSNRLFRNQGDGTFAEVTSTAFTVNDPTYNSKGATWGDYDNDGDLDLYVANGGSVTVGNQPNYLYRNEGNGTFTEVAAQEGVIGSQNGLTDGACWGDVNGDGFLDLYMAHGAEIPPFGVGPRELYLNGPNGNHWLSVELRGIASNGSGIGARVRLVSAAGVQWRTRLGDNDASFANAAAQHFGLGVDSVCDSLQIFWPSGQVDVYESIAVDQRYMAVEGAGLRPSIADLTLLTGPIVHSVESGTFDVFDLDADNLGGKAIQYQLRYENCAGQSVTWMHVEPDSGTVWPGGTGQGPLQLTLDSTGLLGGVYCGRVIFLSNDPAGPDTLDVELTVATNVDAPAGAGLPTQLEFGSARPNPLPAGGRTSFRLSLPAPTSAHVAVYDVAGRHIRTLASGPLPAGYHDLEWNGRDASGQRVGAGVYLVRAVAGDLHATRKVMLLR